MLSSPLIRSVGSLRPFSAAATTMIRGLTSRRIARSTPATSSIASLPQSLPRCSSLLNNALTSPALSLSSAASTSSIASRKWMSSSSSSSSGASSSAEQQTSVYHAGLRYTEFTDKLEILTESPVIPIFRVMNFDGELMGGWESPFSNDQLVDMYKFMVRLSVWDDMLYNIQRQGRISFYIQNQGEEAVQTGMGVALSPDDHLFCQYRELGVFMWRGFTLTDVLNQVFGNKLEEGKGRQMPISYTKKSLNLHTVCTPLTTQVPHAAGAGYAFKNAGEKKCAVAFFGEGAASEGDFHGAMNFAAVLKAQTIFVCRNNGYAISTPVCDQYAGDGIAIRAMAYGMPVVRVDGNDFFAVYLASAKAREMCVEQSTPVCLEFMTYRMGHHSTSDDSSQYRPSGELEAWTGSGIHPIARMRKFLDNSGLWTEKDEEELRKEAKKTMLKQMKECEQIKKVPILPGMFDDVYDVKPSYLSEQRESLKEHLKKYEKNYDLSAFEGIE